MKALNGENIREKIEHLKAEKDILVLAHLYQPLEVQELADYCGDSFELAKRAKESNKKNIVFCGVKFMAESAKIMNPDKHVFLPEKNALCAMAQMVNAEDIKKMRKLYPSAAVVCYINSSAETKAESDMCVTSSNALKIIRGMKQKEIIFVPDKNLGSYIQKKVPEKTIHVHNGFCPVHEHITEETVLEAKKRYPEARLLVHPECEECVIKHADFTGSTSEIIAYAQSSDEKTFIIGTERAVCERLAQECRQKEFILLSEGLICKDMKKITPQKVLETMENMSGEVILEEKIMACARKCLENMMEQASRV